MAAAQFPTRAALQSWQLAQLQHLLWVVAKSNPFYAAKFKSAGVDIDVRTLSDFSRLPFTGKAELVADQMAFAPFGTNLSFPLNDYTRHHQTSGTSGRPLRWLDTRQSWDWMIERWLEIFAAASVTPADRILFAFSFGPFLGFWLAFEAGTRLGALCLPAGGLTSLARISMLLDTKATVICCTPTYAMRLAEAAQAEQVDLSRGSVRVIIVAGEPGGSVPAMRTKLEESWPGARIFDHHGMTETGPVSFECPSRPGFLHVMESGFIAEVLHPETSHPVKPGEPGELVLTNLGRIGSPLIRYRTGDIVKPEALQAADGEPQPCPCGRFDLCLEGGILSRADDMVIVRGVNIYPSAMDAVLRGCGPIAEYQVKVARNPTATEVELLIEPQPACSDVGALIEKVQSSLQRAFMLRIEVHAVPVGSLPRFEMKSKRWVVA